MYASWSKGPSKEKFNLPLGTLEGDPVDMLDSTSWYVLNSLQWGTFPTLG